MVDLGKLLTINRLTTNQGGSWHPAQETLGPFQSGMVGLQVYTQALWNDTVLGSAKLSRVSETTIRAQPRGILFKGTFSNNYVRGSTWGFLPTNTNVPLIRYNRPHPSASSSPTSTDRPTVRGGAEPLVLDARTGRPAAGP